MANADDSPPRPKPGPTVTPKIEAIMKKLAADLAKQNPNAKIKTWVAEGPLGLTEVTAAVENAYPGSGVFRVLVDASGVSYGIHGEKDFADLVRERKWLPDADGETLRKLIDLTCFEGVAMWLDKPPPKVARGHETLTVTLHRTWHPSGGDTLVRVTVPASGKAQVTSP